MEGIKILIIIFGLLFLIENKPTNIIFNFIGLIITVAVLLGLYNTDYISYLLIIIYCSALTIIFGFVIMLANPNHFSKGVMQVEYNFYWTLFIILSLTAGLLYLPEVANTTFLPNIQDIWGGNLFGSPANGEIYQFNLINKIGDLLYNNYIDIFKFMVCTLILLLALIALFYVLNPL